ncbi:NepR family anti-sigma factor [Sphingobium sp. AN641]|uniref:NepR family anti-sigma factor n=1 Tax=Sphingobium sp. AN641 TaxID=3133443 RepID=UPI0030BA5893
MKTDVVNSSDSSTAPEKRPNAPRPRKRTKAADDGHVGDVLRSVYQRTVNEDIPAEMLDLLSKLG